MVSEKSLPSSVLFACNENVIRSPMAEALLKSLVNNRIYVDSVGVKAGTLNGFTLQVMKEVDLNIDNHHPKTFNDLIDSYIDLIITLSPQAHHTALELTRDIACDVEFWPTMDPTSIQGNRETILNAFRDVRDYLHEKIKNRFDL